jgi:hypothetical protein
MLYIPASPNVNGNGVRHIRGRGLRRRKLTVQQRAKLAADILSGCAQLEPSMGQTAELLRVSQAKIRDELKVRAVAAQVEKPVTNLVGAWNKASESEREVAIRMIGVGDVWDIIARAVT